ncbi:MAG: aminotransferase class I/II-fold pyridoxal phosphate-dependent enzyme, partial [Acidobacteria bacterium]|nr:aminotransferase class I/II-fold pyridoxal phosphate-dependent enzyme [Acidobacteriota bacterium]
SQLAAVGAMKVGAEYCRQKVRELAEVRQLVLTELEQLKDVAVIPPSDGAFYFFLKLNSQLPPLALVERLVKEHRVAAIPGSAFGIEGCYLRVAYGALQRETVTEGVGRLVKGIKAILS